MADSLPELYRQMADRTKPKCDACPRAQNKAAMGLMNRCCDAMYCQMAIKVAKEDWGVELETTDHETLPLMGPEGCTAEPHFRPLCTLHTCAIESWGCEPQDEQWTRDYFELRDKIDGLEWAKHKDQS